jgi:pyrroloquinoline quinone (PQQ) biosynthesis protein C
MNFTVDRTSAPLDAQDHPQAPSASTLDHLVSLALSPTATATDVASAARLLEDRALRACLQADDSARAEFLRVLYAIEDGRLSRERRTQIVRHFLARRAFDVQERFIERVALDAPLPRQDFHDRIRGGLDRLARDVYLTANVSNRSPMLEYLFNGSPTFEEVRVFIRHTWIVSKSFSRMLAEFAPSLEMEYAGSTYKNLIEESGYESPGSTAHIALLRRMVAHFEIPFDVEPSTPEAHEYLTNRFRGIRHPEREWGLGVLWAFEAVTSEKHAQTLKMLEKLGVPDSVGEFYRVHIEADEGHAGAFLDVVDHYVVTAAQQSNFLTSLALHTRLRRAYYDQIWREIQAVKKR